MLKVSVLMNSAKYPERVSVLKSILEPQKNATTTFYDSSFSMESDLVLAHESDIEPVENAFYVAVKKYKGIVVIFSGGIYGIRHLSEKLFEFNYTILLANLQQIIRHADEYKKLIPDQYITDVSGELKNRIDSGLSDHEKLTHVQFTNIISLLSGIKNKNILFVDDDLKFIEPAMTGTNVTCIPEFSLTKKILKENSYDIALVDYDLKSVEGNGLDIAAEIRRTQANCAVILLTGRDDFYTILNSFKAGITHFISKSNFNLNYFKRVIESSGLDDAPFILGKSRSMLKMYDLLSFYSSMSDDILITGENGTGKELVARSLYSLGNYKGRMISINCSGIPETLFESEMFGYEGGSFTGALKNGKKSPFEEAVNGILFLDEIGELPIDQQVKLLRVVQERTVTHLGSSRPVKFNTRLIFATNRNLKDEISNNNFRQDFYYRISGAEIVVPPLRERREDIEILAAYFIHKFFSRNPSFDNSELKIDKNSLSTLRNYDFPGNIRELEKIVNRSITFMLVSEEKELRFLLPQTENTGDRIKIEDIAEMLRTGVINSKGLNEKMRTDIIKYFDSNGLKIREQADILGLSEQSYRNLRSKLKI
ncbi:MAG: sigma-54-dependent Fis family transcriptional regulator [Candidatus Delongbacteria bacterium]|nr:sigma-54-dependent Fis family transcriptional regulator [Candidatus Delongbacteria bacterium]